jgi:hypothetical protein
MTDKITITKDQLRSAIAEHLSYFQKDVSDSSHDLRKFEYADEQDFDDFTDSVFDDLSP